MPKKIRELKSMLRIAGFTFRSGKGSHSIWTHPSLPGRSVTLSGNDGDDARKYHEKQVREIIKAQEGKE
jgi:predicted RNA binding protein YcfA (HicA-like mRNA interferase family)